MSRIYKPERIVDLVRKELPPLPAYIAPAILPLGGQLVFGGHAKVGKSFMMLEFARALAAGEPVFECPFFTTVKPCKVLVVEQELGEFGLKARADSIWTEEEIERLGRRADNLWYVSKVPELKLDNPAGRRLLHQMCEDIKPEVLILDPIGRMHGYDENNAQEVAKLFSHLDELQKANAARNMALVISHHMGKPKSERDHVDPLDPYEFRGSSKFFDNPDTLVTIQRYSELPKAHEAWTLRVRFTLRHGESPDDMVFHVNELQDSRVRFVRFVSAQPRATNKAPSTGGSKPLENKIAERPVQETFGGFQMA